MGGVEDLFQLSFSWNEISIILLLTYIGSCVGGFLLIYKQVSLVKKGEFTISDIAVCVFYSLIFGLSVIIIVGMIIIFIVNTPELWDGQVRPEVSPYALIFPVLASMVYITSYPLFDFIFIATTENKSEGLTPFHDFIGKKIINRFNKPYSIIVAILLYLGVIVLPPILIWQSTIFLGAEVRGIIVWSSWMLVYPMAILTFFGAKGYIAGISNVYYHIPEMKRSMFLGFEDGKRSMEDFSKDPGPYILLGLMLFVFIWTWISLIQTLVYYFSGKLAIATMSSYWIFVIIVLAMGIIGYFTRFWGRKIKYRGIDVYFAAYLIAAVGLNVLANFLIVNSEKLAPIFNAWIFTEPISLQYINFVPAAIIEEAVLLTFILYYFLNTKNEFVYNLKYSLITKSSQTFDPIPIFNLLKNSNPAIQKHAETSLKFMFERIPHKGEIDLSKGKFKNAILDGVCDPHPNASRVSIEILLQLQKDMPDAVLPWIVESLQSPNYDKKIPVLETLTKADESLIEKIPINVLLSLIKDPEWRAKYNTLLILSKKSQKSLKQLSLSDFEIILQDPDYEIQVETLKLLGASTRTFPIDMVVDKLKHPNKKVRAAAAFSLKGTNIDKLTPSTIKKLISLMKDPNREVRAEIFSTIAKIGKFRKNFVPIKPLLDGLTDPNESVRKSAVAALESYFTEDSSAFNLDYLLSKILNSSKIEVHNNILELLGRVWKLEPDRIIEILLDYLTFEDEQTRDNISNRIIQIGKEKPELVFDKLIKIPDSAKFISKGIIASTASQIVKGNPKAFIPKLMGNLESSDEQVKTTSISILSDFVEDYMDLIDIRPFIDILKTGENDRIKKAAAKIISSVAIKTPNKVKPFISVLLGSLLKQEKSVKITIAKSLIEIVKKSPEIIPIRPIINLLKDKDSFVRESAAKILFHIGEKAPEESAPALIKALSDDEWIVRDAAVKSLGNLKDHVKDKKEVLKYLIDLLEDDQNWVRRSAMELIIGFADLSPELVPFSKIAINLKSEDERIRETAIGLIIIYDTVVLDDLLPYIEALLNDPSESVREKTVISVSQFIKKIGINKILPSLLRLLSSDSPIKTQRSVAKIFLRTARYEEEDVKKRIIALLKIRCEMSQDSVICSVLQELQ